MFSASGNSPPRSLHYSQTLIKGCGKNADFELYLVPTYDFVMKLLHAGTMIEVICPVSLRKTMKDWIPDMTVLHKTTDSVGLCSNRS